MNTLGYKESTVQFRDLYSNGGGGGLTYRDATYRSTGGGVATADALVDFRQGDLRASSGDLDLAIQGNGFLVLQDSGKTYYTRTGQFSVDDKGFITFQGTNYHLTVLNGSNQLAVPNIDTQRTNSPVATTNVTFADNLSSSATTGSVSDIAVYDANGGKHSWNATFTPDSASPGSWTVKVVDENGATVGTSTLKFNGSTVDPSTKTLTMSATPAGAPALSVALDFSGVTSFSSGTTSTIRAASVDGQAVGSLSTVTVDDKGQIKLTYSNGKTSQLGAVALADFRDPQKLVRVGNGIYENHGTGETRLSSSGSPGMGTLEAKQLETSNVDLSAEFGDLILIQRGFQASSQVVSVSNDMIQQLFGIRGQG